MNDPKTPVGLEITNLCWVRNGKAILDGVDLSIEDGSYTILIGPNGAGKSTLLRCMLALTRPDSGRVCFHGRKVEDWTSRERAGAVSWLPQHGAVREPMPVIELVASARYRFDESRKKALEQAHHALGALDLASFAQRTVPTLSGGENQWIQLASLIAQDARFWLLDEPANHLDPAHRFDVYEVLHQEWTTGRGIVCVTHDIGLLGQLVPREDESRVQVVGMRAGRVEFQRKLDAPDFGEAVGGLFDVRLVPVEIEGRRHWLPQPERS
ncbi:MAG: ABC transporter ATP-binding protein [Myxococcota bacterium]|jgi:iron complex transport system ATP-binding protein|nr:ABC transporter ATP-binding protein [Myxococcota bacterium]